MKAQNGWCAAKKTATQSLGDGSARLGGMQPLTVSVSINTHDEGLMVVKLIRDIDDTADILLHEAKRSLGWSITAHICVPSEKAQELRKSLRDMGVIGAVRPAE